MAIFYSNATSNFGATPFLVGTTANGAPYQTIQDAVDAVVALAAPAVIVIQPGSYTESIAWPANVSVSSSSSALTLLQVTIVGNQTFSDSGSTSFEGILFTSAVGDTFTTGDSGAGTTNLDFQNCGIQGDGGLCIVSVSVAGTSNVTLKNTNCIATTSTCASAANGSFLAEQSQFISTAGDGLEIGAAATVGSRLCRFAGGAIFSGVLITDAGSAYSGELNELSGQQGIRFTAGAQASSVRDRFETTDTYFINSSGAFGSLSIGLPLFFSGSQSVDPQITTTIIPTFASSFTAMPWTNIVANQGLAVNNGYFVSGGALSLALPATSAVGDVIEVSLQDTGTSWEITQGAGQAIRAGLLSTTVGATGTLASTGFGDSVRLVCQTADLLWIAQSIVGSLSVA